jgi:bacillithiol biosynthesis cysteine-adding enzyme BshC
MDDTLPGNVRFLDYATTRAFGPLVTGYLAADPALRPFYGHAPDMSGLREAVARRRRAQPDRTLLRQALRDTHAPAPLTPAQQANLDALADDDTFTVCTAHQPNILSGYLYLVYKILHTIRLADDCAREMPDCRFVPVFWMGSEDSDLEELGQIRFGGEKLAWQTRQTGAVGRMTVDEPLLDLIRRVAGTLGVEPHGPRTVELLQDAYRKGETIATATFRLLQHLFGDYGLLVLQPDHAGLKRAMVPAFREELEQRTAHRLVAPAAQALDAIHKAQVHPREINLFWLGDGIRNRIIPAGDRFAVDGTSLAFTLPDILATLEAEPERFSPNVVLRGLFQETVMPGVAFVGGGSELAYWLELGELFRHFSVPFPVLLLRNSFLLLEAEDRRLLQASGWSVEDLFRDPRDLMDEHTRRMSRQRLDMAPELQEAEQFYRHLTDRAGALDPTLAGHVQALGCKATDRLRALEAKLLRAERRRHAETGRRLEKVRSRLFPGGGLQERHENILPYLARHGAGVIRTLWDASRGTAMRFGVVDL